MLTPPNLQAGGLALHRAAGSLFVCETLEISGDLWELDPRLRTGQGFSPAWTRMSVRRCPQASGASAEWITMNGAFVAKSPPTLGQPFHGPSPHGS